MSYKINMFRLQSLHKVVALLNWYIHDDLKNKFRGWDQQNILVFWKDLLSFSPPTTVVLKECCCLFSVLKEKFVQEPSDTTTAVGQSVTLYCDPPRGKPDPKVIWRKNGETVQTDGRIHITDTGNLEIYSVNKTDKGDYLCVAINKGGEKQSASANLRVLGKLKINNKIAVNKYQFSFECSISRR